MIRSSYAPCPIPPRLDAKKAHSTRQTRSPSSFSQSSVKTRNRQRSTLSREHQFSVFGTDQHVSPVHSRTRAVHRWRRKQAGQQWVREHCFVQPRCHSLALAPKVQCVVGPHIGWHVRVPRGEVKPIPLVAAGRHQLRSGLSCTRGGSFRLWWPIESLFRNWKARYLRRGHGLSQAPRTAVALCFVQSSVCRIGHHQASLSPRD